MQKDNPVEEVIEDDTAEEVTEESDIDEELDSDDNDAGSDSDSSSDEQQDEDNVDDEDKEKDLATVLGSTRGTAPLEVPKNIELDSPALDLQFHPQDELLAVATLEGEILLYKYGCEENSLSKRLKPHSDSCRALRYSEDGDHIYSISKDCSITVTDVNATKQVQNIQNAHESPINTLSLLSTNYIATGDDEGCVKVWDIRKKDAICSWNDMEDFISSMVVDDAKRTLVCSSGDGTITAYNVRNRKKIIQSEEYGFEPTCLAFVKSQTKLAMGTVGKRNPIYFFNFNQFGYHSDKMNGHPNGLSCMIPASDHILITGDDYGTIRGVHVFPHRYLGVIGRHQRGFGVENISRSYDDIYLASCGQDQKVCFWNIQYLEDMERTSFKKMKGRIRERNLPSSRQQNVTDFFADMQDDE